MRDGLLEYFYLKDDRLLSSFILITSYLLTALGLVAILFCFILMLDSLVLGYIVRWFISIIFLFTISIGIRKLGL